jgi:TonB family protein
MDEPLNKADLLNVIATLTARRESGRLQINVSGSAGAFFFKNGKLVDARMGPFSGFPAINYAVSLGQATLKFDSSIEPPVTSTAIASHERVLLKERFGIEAIDNASSEEDQTNEIEDAKLPISISPQAPVAEPASVAAKPPRAPTSRPLRQDEIRHSARARESRRRTARNRQAWKAKEQQITDQLRDQAIEQVGKNIQQQRSVQSEVGSPSQLTGSATSGPATEARGIETPQSTKATGVTEPVWTRKLTGAKNATNRTIIGIPRDDTLFSAAAEPDSPKLLSIWSVIIVIFLLSVPLGYYISSRLSRKNVAASTPLQTEVKTPPSPDADQPVVEGSLHGREAVLQKPEYPARARTEGVSGKVTVAIVVNKQGQVVSAHAVTGAPLLRAAAEAAAKQSTFLPDKLQRTNSGTIAYTFRL